MKFLERFPRYAPNAEKRALLDRAFNEIYRINAQERRVEIELSFNQHEDAELLYEIEDECRLAYEIASVKILPHFPPEEFTEQRFDEITYEASLFGAVTQGFFSGAVYKDDGEKITVELPFMV